MFLILLVIILRWFIMIECTFGWIGSMSFKCWHTKWHTIIIKYMYFTFH